uniref:Uncharacterized protein n=1 Tax=Plectus sambesii TaxID=2011161 RepID=A0A914WWL9_9BILA
MSSIPMELEQILFGTMGINSSNEPIRMEDVHEIAEKLCENPNYYIYYGDPQPLYGLQLPCQIKITNKNGVETKEASKEET